MHELYVTIDVEADGPVASKHSMLSIGSAADAAGSVLDPCQQNTEPQVANTASSFCIAFQLNDLLKGRGQPRKGESPAPGRECEAFRTARMGEGGGWPSG
jgi:hypothetical protein